MNEYYNRVLDFREELKNYASNIFKTYGRELVLRLEEYNLLQNKHNCIESSTAIGFVLEEFLVSKLEMYTHCDESKYIIERFSGSTVSESYDCYCYSDNVKYLINVKAEKIGKSNNGIAAIQQLQKNYCLEEPEQVKSFILFKIRYSIKDAYEDSEYRRAKPRHIYINELSSYCLEEVDLSEDHRQDNRRWSITAENRNNGRLVISNRFRIEHKVPEEDISYNNTFNILNNMIRNNN